MARRRMTTRSATYLLRMTPEEKAALEKRAALAGMTLADALREGAHDLLRRKHVHVVPGERERRHAAAR